MEQGMGTTKRHAVRLQEVRGLETARRCWDLYAKHGWTHAQIAEELHLTQSAVTKALQRAEQLGLKAMLDTVQHQKVVQFTRLERIYREAMLGYARSCEARIRKGKRSSTVNRGSRGVVKGKTSVHRSETRDGDPKFLNAARAALADIRALLGLDSPSTVKIVEPDRPYAGLTDDEVHQELAEMLEQAGVDPATLTRGPKSVN
jgi:predicted transcriptional regulator